MAILSATPAGVALAFAKRYWQVLLMAGLLLTLGAFAGLQTLRIGSLKVDLAAAEAKHQKTLADYQLKLGTAEREFRALETEFHQAQEMHNAEREKEQAAARETAAAFERERQRLRNDIDAYASGRRGAAADTLVACRGRAQTLGLLLDEALQAETELTGDIEKLGTDTRRLLHSQRDIQVMLKKAKLVSETQPQH